LPVWVDLSPRMVAKATGSIPTPTSAEA